MTKSTSGSLENCLFSNRINSLAESRSSIAREQRTPSTPACFRISAATLPAMACLSPEILSRQRPCSARLMALSGDSPDGAFAAVFDSCEAIIVLLHRQTSTRNAAAFPECLYILALSLKNPSLKNDVKKCRQPKLPAPLYELASVIEFQRQLYVPWGLGSGYLPHGGAQPHVWRVVLDVVESIKEVASELQSEPLGNREILMQTQIDVGVRRRA